MLTPPRVLWKKTASEQERETPIPPPPLPNLKPAGEMVSEREGREKVARFELNGRDRKRGRRKGFLTPPPFPPKGWRKKVPHPLHPHEPPFVARRKGVGLGGGTFKEKGDASSAVYERVGWVVEPFKINNNGKRWKMEEEGSEMVERGGGVLQ